MTATLELVQVGCGAVFRDRIVPAAMALRPEIDLRFSHLIDVLPEEAVRQALGRVGLEAFRYHRLGSSDPADLAALLASRVPPGLPLLIASPGPLHAAQAVIALRGGRVAAVEKPLATSARDLASVDRAVRQAGSERLFLFGYYLLEKGLPLALLARRGAGTPAQLRTIDGMTAPEFAVLRDRLGPVREIRGALIEGPDVREWPLAPGGGGVSLDLLSHLLVLACTFCRRFEIARVRLGRPGWRPPTIGESLAAVRLVGDGDVPVELLCATWAETEMQQRWFAVTFAHGEAWMDLEEERLEVAVGGEVRTARVRRQAKYEPQLRQLAEKLERPATPVPYALCSRSVGLALAVREAGWNAGILPYEPSLVPHAPPRSPRLLATRVSGRSGPLERLGDLRKRAVARG